MQGSSLHSQLVSAQINMNIEYRVRHCVTQFWQLLGFSGIVMPVFSLVHSRTLKKKKKSAARLACTTYPAENNLTQVLLKSGTLHIAIQIGLPSISAEASSRSEIKNRGKPRYSLVSCRTVLQEKQKHRGRDNTMGKCRLWELKESHSSVGHRL